MTGIQIYIPSIDGKDLYLSNHCVEGVGDGYSLRDRNNNINVRKFTNTLDFSLERIKLEDVYERVYRRKNFSFSIKGKEYTTQVINVTFNYSVKEFNRIKDNIYVKKNFPFYSIKLEDCACVREGALLGIEINKPVKNPLPQEILGKWFYYEGGVYKKKTNIPTIATVADIRKELYKTGFYCNGIKYVRYKRSSGSSRVGKCLFINEALYPKIHKWELCGIKLRQGDILDDLPSFEAYISLPLSSIIDTIDIDPKSILVIDDYKSVFKDRAMVTRIEDGWLITKPEDVEVSNSIWDGQSLLDVNAFGKYRHKGMILLRQRFFKSCCFNTNIQKFFADNGITDIGQLNGFTLATDIKDIKLITTPSSIKYLKFGSLEQWLNEIDSTFGIVKYEKPTHYFDGQLVQIHYQLINTLQMSQAEVDKLMSPSLSYLKAIKEDPAVLRNHIKYPAESALEITPAISKNDVVYKLLGLNDNFTKTKLYADFRNDLLRSMIKEMRCGRILVNGNYSTLCGNPYEMLKQSVGAFDGSSTIDKGTIFSKRFKFEAEILGSRSPHVTMGNILIAKNKYVAEIEKYFNFSNEIVAVNSINENLLEKLSGCDFDSDTLLLTDDPTLLNAAKKNYGLFLVPTRKIEAGKRKRKYTPEELAELDIATGVNKIGEIINLSQDLNSILWDLVNSGESIFSERIQSLYSDISQLDVMSNIEIDKAKKEYDVDNVAEIKKMKQKYGMKDERGRDIKPNFFGHVAKTKGYYMPNKKNYAFKKTSMDFVQKAINRFRLGRDRQPYISFKEILNQSLYDRRLVYYRQAEYVINYIKETLDQIKQIWSSDESDVSAKYTRALRVRQEAIEFIGDMKISNSTMYHLLALVEDPKCSRISPMMFYIFFGYPNKSFYDVIVKSKEPVPYLYPDTNGDIDLYGFKYIKSVLEPPID